jgi:hypothetical protein
VVPYLLYCFVVDHPLEMCQRIFKVTLTMHLDGPTPEGGSDLDSSRIGHVESGRVRVCASRFYLGCMLIRLCSGALDPDIRLLQQECIRPVVLALSVIRNGCISTLR